MKTASKESASRRPGERGAALVTTLLVATLLLSAGGALIFTTAMSGTNASDSTTEMQAYYGAEAGLQAAVNVLRGNAQSNPAGTKATFRNVADNASLSKWLTYNDVAFDGTSVVKISDNTEPFIAYNLRIINIDKVLAPDEPQRLLIEARGYGPRGAITNKQLIINKFAYDPDLPAAITFVGAEVGASMVAGDFDIGDSSPKGYSGTDSATGSTTIKATFGFTVDNDKKVADDYFYPPPDYIENTKAVGSTDNTPRTKKLANSELPSWLRTADNTRLFLNEIEAIASDQNRLFSVSPGKDNFGTDAVPLLTFVKGNCELSGDGAGMLIVTGNLTIKGDFKYNGVILCLGNGFILRNGGGGGGIYGGLVMANFDRADIGGKFLAKPTFNTNGGGNADIMYNSKWVQAALATLGPSVKGVREF
ncbi:MAG TPA: hypothetical protein VF708_02310 [Pyrinomonadaceae bacterium]